jgi:hypothetical protein
MRFVSQEERLYVRDGALSYHEFVSYPPTIMAASYPTELFALKLCIVIWLQSRFTSGATDKNNGNDRNSQGYPNREGILCECRPGSLHLSRIFIGLAPT